MLKKLGLLGCTLTGLAVGCGPTARHFGAAAGAGGTNAAGDAGTNSAGSGNAAGRGGLGGNDSSLAGEGGAGGDAGADSDAGAAGMAGATAEPDACRGTTCDTPPLAICKDANTLTSYASSGTCSADKCDYPSTDTPCSGDAPKCKSAAAGAQCVACLANADCSNGGTCSSANACVCSPRFNGKHCEFQVFRGLGMLQGDAYSGANNISHDGTVVVGSSVSVDGMEHGFRSVNGGALQFITPASTPNMSACPPTSVDSAANVLLMCDNDGELFLYRPAGTTVRLSWPPGARLISDISLDGKVIVGGAGTLAIRGSGSNSTSLGPLKPGGSSWFNATNGDGSVAVGAHNGGGYLPMRWTAATGLLALPVLSTWLNSAATDVSTDGKVIVGWASTESEVLSGQIAVKWTGASFAPTALGAASVAASATAVNLDGSVIVGSQGYPSVAMLWDGAGAHTIKSLLGATPDLTSDWSLDTAVGVSDDGKFVVGTGTHQTHGEAWVAHLP